MRDGTLLAQRLQRVALVMSRLARSAAAVEVRYYFVGTTARTPLLGLGVVGKRHVRTLNYLVTILNFPDAHTLPKL